MEKGNKSMDIENSKKINSTKKKSIKKRNIVFYNKCFNF